MGSIRNSALSFYSPHFLASDNKSERKISSDTAAEVELQIAAADDVLGDGNDSLEINMETDVKDISGVDEMLDMEACDLSVKPKFMCKFCEREFVTRDQLNRHEKQHTVGSGCE